MTVSRSLTPRLRTEVWSAVARFNRHAGALALEAVLMPDGSVYFEQARWHARHGRQHSAALNLALAITARRLRQQRQRQERQRATA